jgi:fructose-1,6-bisphosphatase I
MVSNGETPAGLTRKSSRNQLEDALELDVNDLQTLGTFIINTAKDEDTSDLSILIQSIGTSCKYIANCVRKLGLAKLAGKVGTVNVQGEEQTKLDLVAHEVFSRGLDRTGRCTVMVSEEVEDVIPCASSPHGRYVCVYDPLDGSSNIDCSVSIGSIFGIYKAKERGVIDNADALQPGRDMVAAGYALYGSACNLVLTIGGCVYGFTLDSSLGEFVLTHPKIQVPRTGSIYSINEGNSKFWDAGMTKYVEHVKTVENPPRSLRYIGSMVADVHRTLLYGGTFSYPRDSKSPEGKLRILYECFPMAYIMEKAGGAASDGGGRILDIEPRHIHQRSPIHMGSADDVETIEKFLREGKNVV